MKLYCNRPSHSVLPSFYPFSTSIFILGFLTSWTNSWHYSPTPWLLFFLRGVVLSRASWALDVKTEKTLGFHTLPVNQSLRFGMILFISSEVMFFFSFFWAYFYASRSPVIQLGALWPPISHSEVIVDNWAIPLLNTLLLVSSGARVTWCHETLTLSSKDVPTGLRALLLSVCLGVSFLLLQVYEYASIPLSFKSLVLGSSFFILTGFHGFHVVIGTLLLLRTLFSINSLSVSTHSLTYFECASWYWHFVDVVWLFLFLFIYGVYNSLI